MLQPTSEWRISQFLSISESEYCDAQTSGGQQTKDEKKSRSLLMLFLELIKDIIVFINNELGLAKAGVKRNIGAAGKAITLVAAGTAILLLALSAIVIAGIAALHTVIPLRLASLLVAAILVVFGAAFF